MRYAAVDTSQGLAPEPASTNASSLFPAGERSAHPNHDHSDRATRVVVVVAVGAVVAWGLAHALAAPAARALMVNGLQFAAASTAAAVSALRVGGARGRPRRQLVFLSAAAGCWALGQLYWTVSEVVAPGVSLFPSPGDIGFVLTYPAMVMAVLSSPSMLHRASRVRMTLDGLVVVLSLVFVAWAVALDAATRDLGERSGADLLAISYPIADIVVVTVAVVALIRAPLRWRTPIALVTVGFGLILGADAGFAYLLAGTGYETGSVIDLGWILGWLTVAAAATTVPRSTQAEPHVAEVSSRIAQLGPIAALGAVTVVAVVQYLQGDPFTSDPVLWWTGLALFGINVARTSAARAEVDVVVAELATTVDASEELLAEHRLALEGAELGTWRWHAATSTLVWSVELEAIYGLEPGTFGGTVKDYEALLVPEDVEHVRAMVAECVRSDHGVMFEHRISRPDGTSGWVQNRGRVQRTSTGALASIVGVAFDTTARHDTERTLGIRAEQSAALAELGQRSLSSPTLAAAFDAAIATLASTLDAELCKILELDATRSSLRLVAGCGWAPGLVGAATVGIGTDSQAGFTLAADEATAVVVDDLPTETRFSGPPLLHDHGVRSGMSTVIRTAEGNWGVLGVHTTQSRQFGVDEVDFLRSVAATIGAAVDHSVMTDELTRRSLHDELTGLPNRALLQDRLSVAVAAARRAGRFVAVLHVGIDRFTLVNESFGQQVGDQVLVAISRRIEQLCGPGDTAARWGGDEFVVAATLSDKHAGVELAARALATLSAPMLIEDPPEELFLAASIGLAVANGTGDAASLVRDAGVASRRASELGGRRYELFDDGLRIRTIERLQTEREIRCGLANGQFEPHYQPIVRAVDGAMLGVEALARWRHPTRGLLLPGDFLEATDTAGLLGELGEQILTQAATDAARWNPLGPRLKVSVNVSTSQLVPAFVDTVRRVLNDTGAQPDTLCVEILETALADLAEPATILAQLRELGICVYIDDFGTGHSTLARLSRLPVNGLKIDRAFVTDITERDSDQAVAAGIVQLGHTLGLAVTAEGVETPEQLATLAALGCEHVQGWLFAPALPASDIDDLIDVAATVYRHAILDWDGGECGHKSDCRHSAPTDRAS